jgi:hypothetical protein
VAGSLWGVGFASAATLAGRHKGVETTSSCSVTEDSSGAALLWRLCEKQYPMVLAHLPRDIRR